MCVQVARYISLRPPFIHIIIYLYILLYYVFTDDLYFSPSPLGLQEYDTRAPFLRLLDTKGYFSFTRRRRLNNDLFTFCYYFVRDRHYGPNVCDGGRKITSFHRVDTNIGKTGNKFH